jgi:ATP/maltotriose-dependent transcriptional regulator MalT
MKPLGKMEHAQYTLGQRSSVGHKTGKEGQSPVILLDQQLIAALTGWKGVLAFYYDDLHRVSNAVLMLFFERRPLLRARVFDPAM